MIRLLDKKKSKPELYPTNQITHHHKHSISYQHEKKTVFTKLLAIKTIDNHVYVVPLICTSSLYNHKKWNI